MRVCDKCGGSGKRFVRGAKTFREKYKPCCKCHDTGIAHASHKHVIARREQLAAY